MSVLPEERLATEVHTREPQVTYFAPLTGETFQRGFYVIARRRVLAGPFALAREAEEACVALGGVL